MYLVIKLGILIGFVAAAVGVTKSFLSERGVLAEFGVDQHQQVLAVLFTWLCVWVPIAVVAPVAGPYLTNPLPFGVLLAIPAIVVVRKIKLVLEHSGTDRTKRAKDASDHAIFVGYASVVLAIADWGFARLVGSLPNVTGGQL